MSLRRIPPTTNPSLMGDTPSEFDMFWNDQIDFDDMSPEAQAEVTKRLNAIEKAREIARKETKNG